MNFDELLDRLSLRPAHPRPGAVRAVRWVRVGRPEKDSPHTLLLLRAKEGACVQGAYAGILSTGPVAADCPTACLPPDTDLDALAGEIRALLEDEALLAEARAALLSVYLDKPDVQALVDAAYACLGLPVTVFDLSTSVAAFAGEQQIKSSGFSPALYVLDKGFAAGCTNERTFNLLTKTLMEAAQPTVITFGGGVPRLCCRLRVFGEYAGHISIMGTGRPLRPSDYAVESLLRDLIERLWQSGDCYVREPAALLLRDLYDGNFCGDREKLTERLQMLKLENDGLACVLFVCAAEGTARPQITGLLNRFVRFHAGAWATHIRFFVRPEGAFCLISVPDGRRLKEFVELTREFCRRNGCRGGVSKPFRDLADFRTYCDQARRLSGYGGRTGTGAVVTFADGCWEDLMHCLSQTVDPLTFVDPAVLNLREYDRVGGGSLVETLCTYLETGGNLTEAAKRLYVHRNTMVRRMERISELLGFSPQGAEKDLGWLLLSGRILQSLEQTVASVGHEAEEL